MTPKNPYLIENKKPVETVYELKNEVPSFEEFANSYEYDQNIANSYHLENQTQEKGYGPCQNALCGCSCSKYTCDCGSASAKLGKWGPSIEAKGRIFKDDIDFDNDDLNEKMLKASLEVSGNPKRGVGGQVSASLFKYDSDQNCEMKFLGGAVGGELSSKGVIGRATADLYNVKNDGFEGRIGLGVDTGISLEEGLEVKAIGFGFTLGNQVGVSTPFGEAKIDKDKCVIQ